MALPFLLKRMYNGGTDEVIKRGKKIFATSTIDLLEYDELMANVVFRVKDDTYSTYYKVYINQFRNEKAFTVKCSCPYNLSEICRHKAAALLNLQDLLDKNQLSSEGVNYQQIHTIVKMKQLDLKAIRMFASFDAFADAEEFLRTQKAVILSAVDETVKAELNYKGNNYNLIIRKNEERNFDTSCNCMGETEHPICVHKLILFLQLLSKHGINYFDSIRNWDNVKNKLLSIYGYSLKDDLTNKFEFAYVDGKPFLRLLDKNIKRLETPIAVEQAPPSADSYKFPIPILNRDSTKQDGINSEIVTNNNIPTLGLVLTTNTDQYPFLQFELCSGIPNDKKNGFVDKVEKLDLSKFIDTTGFTDEDKLILQNTRKFTPLEVSKYINRNSPFGDVWQNIIEQQQDSLPKESKQLMAEYFHPKIKKLIEDNINNQLLFWLPQGKTLSSQQIKPLQVDDTALTPYFIVTSNKNSVTIECRVKLPLNDLSINESEHISPFIFQFHDIVYGWSKKEDIEIVDQFLPSGSLTIDKANWQHQLQNFIIPLTKEYEVDFVNLPKEIIKNCSPEMKMHLSERGDYLMFEPIFSYKNYPVTATDGNKIIFPDNERLLVIYRNLQEEQDMINKVQALHSNFVKPNNGYTLALKGTEVLKNNWFFLFVDAMKENNTIIYGFDALRNFRFNTAKPSTRIHISSNTDWFDAKVEIDFNGQKVTVADVKKALANKQQFVPLADGTLGILPEDWVRKYSLLFKVGDGRQDSLKLSKFQFSVIEDLYNERDEEELFIALEEKYDKLRYNHEIKPIDTPAHLTKTLRPYQASGFQWLNYLKEVQWGGILADDMGLGKTIQALSFMHHLKEEKGNIKALVVCPTTLLYNWQNEIKKFTPTINFYVHHGSTRLKDAVQKPSSEIIITTYGTLRSDIKLFMEVEFDYVVLDESQAIKNPSSKVTKAACLLRAKNRLCLSGTPLQNNTFDIFAQMNFLNPGMLGSQEFFKTEFAVPIDKFGEKEQKEHLRKLLYPFILRRTKEQVAKDLPEKQEMILFCDMGEEQRKIYEAYRNDFRDKIMGVVQDQGIGKSQLTILQGLMKLRQICDSPAIIKNEDDERYPNESVKLEELGREISENISNHKALIFSQFLGMLSLIKAKMKELGIDYEYFDGSTSSPDREKAINRFQNDENCRVFLISLKAGGVGLNLTAADYVYIVDPWWNPAVEQQAIDRTHRIGQTKNIFAYRMICTDTVEDKILKLQERKRILAKDLITDDEGFVKSLTKDDVMYLFS
jgi:superfamily II DNA or RNA helicase